MNDTPKTTTCHRVDALHDNVIWWLQQGQHALAVDPGDAQPLLEALGALMLSDVLITHHHHDHCGGLPALIAAFPELRIWGPQDCPHITHPVSEGDVVVWQHEPFVLCATPGHTLDHLCYLHPSWVFCGDTLFRLGCGRVFEGTHAQMHASLMHLVAQAAPEAQVCCAHEYSVSNAAFACQMLPEDPRLPLVHQEVIALRSAHQGTLVSTMAEERRLNPFLRCADPDTAHLPGDTPLERFVFLRDAKDRF